MDVAGDVDVDIAVAVAVASGLIGLTVGPLPPASASSTSAQKPRISLMHGTGAGPKLTHEQPRAHRESLRLRCVDLPEPLQ